MSRNREKGEQCSLSTPSSSFSTRGASSSDLDAATTNLNVNTMELTDGPSDALPGLSEAQLRRLYDEEEVKRFMNVFSAYVTEVRVPGASTSSDSIQSTQAKPGSASNDRSDPIEIPVLPRRPAERYLSERIAHTYLVPYLPLASRASPSFTIKRLRLTTQRLYLATVPPYQKFLLDLVHLALWKDKQRSMVSCICFWILWFYDLLLPALIFRILWSLLRRRLLPYPSLKELQERQRNALRARRFGEELQERLSATTIGPKDIWSLFKHHRTSTRNQQTALPAEQSMPSRSEFHDAAASETDVLNYEGSEEDQDIRREALQLLNEVADIHERVKNIFTWRKPHVSRRYAYLLTVASFGVLFLPAHYISKMAYMSGGIVFWHVVPVIAALRPDDRARIPSAFADAPTDAEYAIELIAKRVTSGESAALPANRNESSHARGKLFSTVKMTGASNDSDATWEPRSHGVNWRKWGTRVAQGKSLINNGKQLFSIDDGRCSGVERSPHSRDVETEQTYTFPAQHATVPGLLTLTSTTIFFTPLTATRPKLVIPCTHLRGVKKIGLVKGLSLTWLPMESDRSEEIEERFHWVGNRDELFARLLVRDGGHWMRI